MQCKMLPVVAGLLFVGASFSGARAEAAPIHMGISDHATSVMPVRWLCSWQPGSGLPQLLEPALRGEHVGTIIRKDCVMSGARVIVHRLGPIA